MTLVGHSGGRTEEEETRNSIRNQEFHKARDAAAATREKHMPHSGKRVMEEELAWARRSRRVSLRR